jgi:uncharacterized protein involved in tolerance to divalent cations
LLFFNTNRLSGPIKNLIKQKGKPFFMDEFCYIVISATSREEADRISEVLVEKKLIAGSLILKGDSRFWWKGRVENEPYWNVHAYSLIRNKERVIEEVEGMHKDEVPIIAFLKIDGNEKFLNWIREEIGKG